VLADATKYGTVGLAGIAPLSAVGTLITDDRVSTGPAGHAAEELLRQSVGELRLARIPPASPAQLGSSSGRSQGWERPELLPTSHNDPLPARSISLPDGQMPSATAFKGNDA
jgi:hypothetical protein